jgi:hypothetical protein
MLSVVPGISTTMARSLLATYGSLAAIADAAEVDLRRHPGIGRVRAGRLAQALRGDYVTLTDRDPEPERAARGAADNRRWLLSTPGGGAAGETFDRRAIALRALRGAAAGTQLVDRLTGEVVEQTPPGSAATRTG